VGKNVAAAGPGVTHRAEDGSTTPPRAFLTTFSRVFHERRFSASIRKSCTTDSRDVMLLTGTYVLAPADIKRIRVKLIYAVNTPDGAYNKCK